MQGESANTSIELVCPACRTPLEQTSKDLLQCVVCDRHFPKSPIGSWDLRNGEHFEEWFATSSGDSTQEFATEQSGSFRVIDAYVIPFLQHRGITPEKGPKILSDGCGIGADVECLRQRGYNAWGIDPGDGRGAAWQQRACVEYLIHASGTSLPFPDEEFDFVFSEGVIEHVGLSGDQGVGSQLRHMDSIHSARQQYIMEMLRVLRPGGLALIAAPNGWFPIDFFHGGRRYGPLTMVWHWPWQARMNSTLRDIQRYVGGRTAISIESLSLRGFFNTEALTRHNGIWPIAAAFLNGAFLVIPKQVMSTIGPYFAVAITKH